jgi:hypothetical protein
VNDPPLSFYPSRFLQREADLSGESSATGLIGTVQIAEVIDSVPAVSLSTTATAEIIIVTAADLPYRVSEENMPSNFRRARAFFVDQMNIPPAKIRWFSVAFRH